MKKAGLADIIQDAEKLSPENRGFLAHWQGSGNSILRSIDDVFNKHIDETGKVCVVKEYEEAYPSLRSATQSKKKQ